MVRNFCDLISFIKRHYLYFLHGVDESVSGFYKFYADKVDNPPSLQKLSVFMQILGVKLFNKRVGNQIHRWYQISFDDLDDALKRISYNIGMQIVI